MIGKPRLPSGTVDHYGLGYAIKFVPRFIDESVSGYYVIQV